MDYAAGDKGSEGSRNLHGSVGVEYDLNGVLLISSLLFRILICLLCIGLHIWIYTMTNASPIRHALEAI